MSGIPSAITRNLLDCLLANLGVDKVDILYLHAPDHKTPIEDTLKAIDEFHKQGKFKELGLSNYAAWQVVDIIHICRNKGYVVPTVYQGLYNPITRQVEKELLPCLKKFNVRFYAYNVTCGGLLSGKHYDINKIPTDGSRFDNNTPYQSRYWKESYFQALDKIRKACEQTGTKMIDAAHRYMIHHSQLDGKKGDKIILGVSKIEHLIANAEACLQGPLPVEVINAFDEGANLTMPHWFNYFR